MQDSRVMVREHIKREGNFCLGIFKDIKTASEWCKLQKKEDNIYGDIELINLQKRIKKNEYKEEK